MPASTNDLIAYDDGQGNTYEVTADVYASMLTTAGTTYKTPTADFTFAYNGQILQFKNGVVFVPDAVLLAALVAANAPII